MRSVTLYFDAIRTKDKGDEKWLKLNTASIMKWLT